MVVGEGFEPSKSVTADLQSAPFGRSGTPPRGHYIVAVLRRKDYSELRSSTFGPLPLATFSRWCSSRTFEVDDGRFAVSSLMIAREPHHGVIQILMQDVDGGGGRIRTFEVDDGRFTVCSLWPLGNPTTGSLHCCGVAEEGLFGATLLNLRAVAFGNVLSLVLESNLRSR